MGETGTSAVSADVFKLTTSRESGIRRVTETDALVGTQGAGTAEDRIVDRCQDLKIVACRKLTQLADSHRS